jgi:thiol-disulfide isomerase/thioredoxin
MRMPSFKNLRNRCKRHPYICAWIIVVIIAIIVALTRANHSSNPVPNTIVNVEGFQENVEVNSPQQLVPASDEVIVALFYTNWCGYCKRFKPKFNELLSQLETINNNRPEGRVSLRMVDCETQKDICGRNQINAYPTLKVFRPSSIDANPTGEEDVVTTANITLELLTELTL